MGTLSLVWRWGRSGSGAELDDGVAFDGRQPPAGGQHGTGEELLVRLVDVEHDVAELLEVLRGEVPDRGDLQFRPADGDHVTGVDRVAAQLLRRTVDDAHLRQRLGQGLAEEDDDARRGHVPGLGADVDDDGAVVGHGSPSGREREGAGPAGAVRARPSVYSPK